MLYLISDIQLQPLIKILLSPLHDMLNNFVSLPAVPKLLNEFPSITQIREGNLSEL